MFLLDCLAVHASVAKRRYVSWGTLAMLRRLIQIFENETAFTVGVICLGLFPVAILLIVLVVR